jgi:hypothetical protein
MAREKLLCDFDAHECKDRAAVERSADTAEGAKKAKQ